MVKAYDVPADLLIKRLAEEFKKDERFKPPEWSAYVKTGSHIERLPQDRDWWYTRVASIMRKVYLYGPISIKALKIIYGGRKRVGYAKAHHRDAGGAIIRNALHQLENANYIMKAREGRIVTPDGMRLVDAIAKEIHKELVKVKPELAKYA
ncbi:MAG: 30S ribosomal protein S19e [Candidatus Nitrosothermus koennekii]|nr:MAG: 30S ribosomal protein S19e [Candidatus Nitrosothermus koennekii]